TCALILTSILNTLSPTTAWYVADDRLKPVYKGAASPDWGNMGCRIAKLGGPWFGNMADLIVVPLKMGVGWGAFYFNATSTGTYGPGPDSLYAAKDIGELLVRVCREVLVSPQWELPELAKTSKNHPHSMNGTAVFEGATRFLLMPDGIAPLPVYIDYDRSTLKVNPCGAYASQYKVDEPFWDKSIYEAPGYAIALSPFTGGSSENYKTLLRFCAHQYVNAILADAAHGFEILVPDAGSGVAYARRAEDLTGNITGDTDWASFHARVKIARWGMPRGVIDVTSSGVGLHPFASTVHSAGFWDFSEFPLGRYCHVRVGLMGDSLLGDIDTIGDVRSPKMYVTIGVTRTPGGKTKLKLIELEPTSYPSGDSLIAPPPPPPPPPPTEGGPTDAPSVSFPGAGTLAGMLSGTKTVLIQAVNTYGTAQVTLYCDGRIVDTQAGTTVAGVQSRVNDTWSFALDTTLFAGTVMAPVTHTLRAQAYDLAGHSAYASLTITIGN
ncbi:MAG: hypothetical protein Q8921_15285, partial [Bacteroidota bacterium]|nr:hypothetical protein [Bacteroidota bacterium]